MTVALTVQRRVRAAGLPSTPRLRQWVAAALGKGRGGELGLVLVGRTASRTLNQRYRRRDRATNVLSFPASEPAQRLGALGDLVICPALLRAEARAQGKSLRAHWAHLVIHGVLHLQGFDHVRTKDARRMEQREIRILRRLGFADPYQPRSDGGRAATVVTTP